MADPVWGASSSALSDDDTARMLCAFHHKIPLLARRLHSQQQKQQSLYHSHNETNHEMPPGGNSLRAFGYPSNGTHSIRPVLNQCDAMPPTLLDKTVPSTSCDDWYRQQQLTIQEQLEQQEREITRHMQQQQHQHLQAQLQLMQTQIQQQDQVQRHQEKAERRLNRIHQPQYSKEFDQTEWSHGGHLPVTDPWSFHNEKSHDSVMDRCIQPSRRIYYRKEQEPTNARIEFTSTPVEYKKNAQGSGSMERSKEMFARRQVSQLAQPPFHAPDKNPFHQWDVNDLISFAGTQTDNNKALQMRNQHRYTQPQPLQPQAYYSAKSCRNDHKEVRSPRQASNSISDDAFLNSIMRYFPTGSNDLCRTSHDNTTQLTTVSTQSQIQTEAKMPTQEQIGIHSRPQIPPSGAAVVPGVSLASQTVRFLTMQDILNGEDGSSKIDLLKDRPCPIKQGSALPKRKVPKNSVPAKRQKLPQQPKALDFKKLPENRQAGAILQSRSASNVARASKQAIDTTVTNLPIPTYLALHAQEMPTNFAPNLFTKIPYQNIAAYRERKVNNGEMVTGKHNPYTTCRSNLQLCNAHQDTQSQNAVFNHEKKPRYSELNVFDANQVTKEPRLLTKKQPSTLHAFNSSKDAIFGKMQRQESSLNRVDLESSDQSSSIKLDVVKNGNSTTYSKKRSRAKLPLMRSVLPTARLNCQPEIQRLLAEPNAVTAITPTSATQAPAVAEVARSDNKTVVIFCKRDFMRYQAVKIWRKYQEQLEKQDEWREVRVAGKRTRYLHSRYDDEIRRTQKRTYRRSGRRRNYYLKDNAETRCPEAEFVVRSHASRRGRVSNIKKFPASLSTLTDSSGAKGESSLSGDGESDGDKPTVSRDPSPALDEHVSRINGITDSAMEPSVLTQPNNTDPSVFTVAEKLQKDGSIVSNDNIATATSGSELNGAAVVDKLSDGNFELTLSVADSVPKVAPSIVDLSPVGNHEVADTIPDSGMNTTVVDVAPNNTIDSSSSDAFSNWENRDHGFGSRSNIGTTTVAE